MTIDIKNIHNLSKEYVFPKTRYQGSKYKLRDWIKHSLKQLDFETAIDAFSGTGSVAYTLKEMGKEVYSNDILPFNYQVSKALIENSSEQITHEDYQFVIKKHIDYNYSFFIRDTFHDIYYLDDENIWLDIIVQNINQVKNEYKQAMLFWALYQACISKRPYNLFHRKNLYVRTSDVERNFGNKATWDKPFDEHFKKFIKEANNAIFNNRKQNKSFCGDIIDLKIEADLIYIDTPYIPNSGTLTLYGEFYHFLNGLTDYPNWESKVDYNSKHKKLISEYSIWEDKKNIYNGFEQLIEKFKKSIIVISYRDDGIPTVKEISDMLRIHGKKVHIETVDYKYVLSKKQNLQEVLIIGE